MLLHRNLWPISDDKFLHKLVDLHLLKGDKRKLTSTVSSVWRNTETSALYGKSKGLKNVSDFSVSCCWIESDSGCLIGWHLRGGTGMSQL